MPKDPSDSLNAPLGMQEALNRIEKCRDAGPNGVALDLSGLGLTALPPEIGQLTALTRLDVSSNQLSAFPAEIGQLTALTALFVSNNQLSALPAEIGRLTALTGLDVSSNQLSALPAEIGRLTALTRLFLSDNQFSVLPAAIGQLMALTVLFVSNNQLSVLPAEISRLTALTELFFYNNEFADFPAEIGQLTALTHLDLDSNQLSDLPAAIGQLTTLIRLDLANNQLASLPPEIRQLTALTELFLHGNPALTLPNSILGPTFSDLLREPNKFQAARPEDILRFYFALRQGASAGTLRSVNEIKVMLVGRGGAGKTSLRRFFMGQPHDTMEQETPGIALNSFKLRCAQRELTVRLWDFAGQEITHALHQFFLTEGCVYVLVLDPRSNTEMRDAEYWLGLLKRYGGGAPVLVALNRQDARQGGYDVDRRMLLERFPFITNFALTNCEKREGCEELREKLCAAVESLKETEPPHLKVPKAWLEVMEDCAGEARGKPQPADNTLLRWLGLAGHAVPSATGQQHLKLEEFQAICSKRGETEPEKQESLARLLHKLGAVLHFIDEPRLRDTTVLNPHWVTDGVYRLLRFKDFPGSNGTLTLEEALKALPGETDETARFLLRLMQRFEMCFPLDEEEGGKLPTKWLIPGALAEFQPEGVTADWQKPGSVRMRYIYDPLPEGVLPRFIVMTHLLSEGKPRWRNGVVLEDGNAAALVRRGENRNHVEVTAFGPHTERLRLLEIIQGNMERIHADLPDPKPVAELELAGLPGVFRSIADLEAAERQGVPVAVSTSEVEAQVEPARQLNQRSEPQARDGSRVPLRAFLSYSHEDKSAQRIFLNNLNVLEQKKFITPWQDGLIEPGTLWAKEIDENLAKMDIFLGLLTTSFLASGFIQTVELAAVHERLSKADKDFLFVLILVEDEVSLTGLKEAGYQILKPGGKAVSKHPSRRIGFNVAQAEIEELILKRQSEKRSRKPDEPGFELSMSRAEKKDGITIFSEGGYINKPITRSQSSRVGGNIANSQVGQTLTNCLNLIQQQAPGERKALLEELQKLVGQLLTVLPAEKKDDAQQVADDLEVVVKQAIHAKPNRKWYDLSAEGLLEAAKDIPVFGGVIAGTITAVGRLLWVDFVIPGENKW